MPSIVPLEMAVSSNGVGVEAWPKTYSAFFSTSVQSEKVGNIPTVDGVSPKYMFVQPGENFTFSVVDDANASANSIVAATPTGAECSQLYINQPTLIELDPTSTHFHFYNETATSFVTFSFYS
jgi:hypothetical protein